MSLLCLAMLRSLEKYKTVLMVGLGYEKLVTIA
jgi:hypothetical protein